MKQLARTLVGYSSALPVGLARKLLKRRAVVVCYHAISRGDNRRDVDIHAFEQQLEGFAKRLSIKPLNEVLATGVGLAIVFDDAYRSVLELAAPMMEARGVPYTVAVPTGRVGHRSPPESDFGLTAPVMTWHELMELPGAVSFASHLVSHTRATSLPLDLLERELSESRDALLAQFGGNFTNVVVWPFGESGPRELEAARSAGYVAALAGGWGTLHRAGDFEWRRISIENNDTMFAIQAKLNGGYDWLTLAHKMRKRSLVSPNRY